MKNNINKPTVTIEAHGIKIKVIRVGKTPNLQPFNDVNSKRIRTIHSHFTYEVFFVTDGSLEIVTDETVTTYERKVVIIPPRKGHYTVPKSPGSFCLLISLDDSSKQSCLLKDTLNCGAYELDLSEDVEYYIKALSRKSDAETEDAEKDVKLLATLIFNEIIGSILPADDKKISNINECKHIGTIETYINSNLHKKITLCDVAEQVYLSTRQVSRILQKEYGCTLSELVNNKKLEAVRMMLKNTDMKVGEIISQVNFGAENYFYLLFKKKYGISPLQYRKNTESSR